jgi:hypothetical protein
MSISTYSELQTACANWLSRVDLTARIPEFIALAEAKIQRTLRVRQMETRVSATATEWMSLPTDYIELRNIKITSTRPYVALTLIDPGQADADYTGATGLPLFYTLQGNQVRLIPAPDATTYTVEMIYFKKIPALSVTNTTNWLLTAAPDAYLYGTVTEALVMVQDDGRAAAASSAFARVIEDLHSEERRSRWSGSVMRMRVDRGAP